ncbi:hypothetical protein lerEdw1_013896 [Lerista edwardsae]|nr:hypothetical protein lerEdw1_013896 [Lerista edwardsae]
MSDGVASPPGAAAAAEEGAAAGAGGPADGDGGPDPAAREVRCSDCIVWNRQQTWLCVVPLFIGFVGLGLSLMLLKWIVVGSVKEYVPTELMDSKGIEQDPFFLSKPTTPPKSMETTTSTATTTTSRTHNRISTRLTTMTRAPTRFPGTRGPIRASPPRSTTARHTVVPPHRPGHHHHHRPLQHHHPDRPPSAWHPRDPAPAHLAHCGIHYLLL